MGSRAANSFSAVATSRGRIQQYMFSLGMLEVQPSWKDLHQK